MFTMKKKIVSGSLVALMALGLAGCANSNSAAPASKASQPRAAKVTHTKANKQATNKAANVSSSSTSTVTASKQSNQASAATTSAASNSQVGTKNMVSQPASYSANAGSQAQANAVTPAKKSSQVVNSTKDNVLSQFQSASGLTLQNGHQFVLTSSNNGVYQIEDRDTNGDSNIAHLNAIYQYNTKTNQVQQVYSNSNWSK